MSRGMDSRAVLLGAILYGALWAACEGLAAGWPHRFGFRWVGAWGPAADVGAGLACGLAVVAATWPFMRRSRVGADLARRLAAVLDGMPAWGVPILAVTAGAAEEVLFRGALWTLVEGPFGTAAAWAVTSLLFGAAHGLFRAPLRSWSLFALLVGGLLGALRLPGGVLAPAVAHGVIDLLNLPLVRRAAKGTRRDAASPCV